MVHDAGAPLILGSFSAGSNVTGIAPDAQAIAALLHRYGAIAAFDYASAGSCKHIDCAGAGVGGSEMRAQRSRARGAGPLWWFCVRIITYNNKQSG